MQLDATNFIAKWALIFADNTTQQISEADMRDFSVDIADSFGNILGEGTVKFVIWDGTGSLPTPTVTTLYVLTGDHETFGHPDFIPSGAWAIAQAGATVIGDFYIKP